MLVLVTIHTILDFTLLLYVNSLFYLHYCLMYSQLHEPQNSCEVLLMFHQESLATLEVFLYLP